MKNTTLIEAWNSANPSPADKERIWQAIRRQAAQTRPRFHPRRALALAFILAAIFGATALALSEGGLINWFGKKVAADLPFLIEDEQTAAAIQERAQKAKELIEEAPEDELWIAEIWEKTRIASTPARSFASLEALSAHLASAGLPFPSRIPSGFTFVSGGIAAYLSKNTAERGLLPLADQPTEYGFAIKKYRLTTDYAADIDHWHATFRDDKGNVLTLACFRDSRSTQYSFNTSASGEHDVLDIPGMTEALYIRNADNRYEHSLHFRLTGLPRLFRYNWYSPRETPDVKLHLNYYDSLVYEFASNTLGREALMEIAGSLQ